MMRLRSLLLLLPVLVSLTGCTSGQGEVPEAGNVDANGQAISSVPWNKPESWETQGQLSGMAGH